VRFRRVHHFPPREPDRHGLADLLTLVGAVRRLAFDHTLPASEALGRIRDAIRSYDEEGVAYGGRAARPGCCVINYAHGALAVLSASVGPADGRV
jgi:hypothetical protein